MYGDPHTGLLSTAQYIPSPNCDERPAGVAINLLVVHNISLPPRQFGGGYITQLFTNQLDYQADPFFQTLLAVKVSAHLLIRRQGEIIQYVPFTQRAWHAGRSEFQGQSQCNDFSIGIELEGADDIPYTTAQYQQLAAVTHCLMQLYPAINKDRIVGHSDIAPDRKTDPGPAFKWGYFFTLLEATG